MKRLITALCVMCAVIVAISVTSVWAKGDRVDGIERTMTVRNENAELSNYTYLIGDSASTYVIAELNPSYPAMLWMDLQILKNKGIKKLNVYIDSGGGHVFSGLAYATQLMSAWKDIEVTTYAMGLVASAALPIFLCGKHRIALGNTLFMVHKGELNKPPTTESQRDLRAQTEMMELVENNYNNIIIIRSKLTLTNLLEKTEKITWFTSQQAKDWGMVEEIR